MRVIFMGTPDFAVPTLRALVAAGHDVVAVYSQPPRPAGRGKKLQPSPVQICAEAEGIAVRTPVSLKTPEAQAEFAGFDADIAVVAAYGLILPQTILDAPKHGCLNVHGSLLPRWRGAAPVQRAILAGDAVTGVTIMQMAAGLDTGPMLAKAETRIGEKTAGVLTSEIAAMGAQLMLEVLANLSGFGPEAQDDAEVTYARKIDKAEARLDFSQSAEQVVRQVRAFNPVPGTFFEFSGERYRVLAAEVVEDRRPREGGDLRQPWYDADNGPRLRGDDGYVLDDQLTIACAENAIRPTLIQRAGRPAMPLADLLRGMAIPAGTHLA